MGARRRRRRGVARRRLPDVAPTPSEIQAQEAESDAVAEVVGDAGVFAEAALFQEGAADGEVWGVGEFDEDEAGGAVSEVGDERVDELAGEAVAAGVGGDGHGVHLGGAGGA
jgi:hypothetical protein